MKRKMDNGEVKKSSEGQAAVAKAGAGLGAPTALMTMAKEEEESRYDGISLTFCSVKIR